MKKLIIIFMLLFCLSINKVSALDLELNNKVISFPQDDGYNLQGFTSSDKYIFVIMIKSDDSKSIIKVFDINTYKLVFSKEGDSLGHANDVTYNSKENRFYVAISGGSEMLYAFDGDTFEFIEKIEIDLPIRSITYMEDLDKYAVRLVTSGYILDSDFNKEGAPFVFGMNVRRDVGRQGWGYYNDLIYYCNWSWKRFGGDGSNRILVYDLDGNYLDVFKTDTTIGEIEDISFYNDKMILGFNSYDDYVDIYVEDIPKVNIIIEEENNNTNNDKKEDNKLIYIIIASISLVVMVIMIIIKTRLK